ncbi:hypothetical protein J4218_04840 [Candidatus Pacearchaeota archaeon]|nr:hypothetical protein [Candidatus Pacearchaeota archaeon]
MINNLLYIILLILGFPSGLYLTKVCREEVKKWKKRFLWISGLCFIIAILVFFTNFQYKIPVIIALLFIIVTLLTIVWKSSIGKK